jgi:hypothetical protein
MPSVARSLSPSNSEVLSVKVTQYINLGVYLSIPLFESSYSPFNLIRFMFLRLVKAAAVVDSVVTVKSPKVTENSRTRKRQIRMPLSC